MVNWKELGEVPDSEEEGFDSGPDPGTTCPHPAEANPVAGPPDHSVWDVPESPEKQAEAEEAHDQCSRPLAGAPPHTGIDQLPDSSPLSSVPSESELPPIDELMLDHGVDGIAHSAPSVGADAVAQARPLELASPDQRSSRIEIHLRQSRDFDDDAAAESEARLVAVRSERSLRPRKPIQEHPYLLEGAQYNSLFKKHGIKPVRVAFELERQRRGETEQDADFQQESQETTDAPGESAPGESEALPHASSSSLGALLDPFEFPSSSPPRMSPTQNGVKNSSRASSQGETDDTSVLDHDLPSLDDLFKPVPRLVSAKLAKRRQPSPPPSTIRKRRRLTIIDSDPLDPLDEPPRRCASPDPLASPSRRLARRPEVARPAVPVEPHSQRPSARHPQAPRADAQLPSTESIIDVSSDEDDGHPSAGSNSICESEEEVVHTIGRRIRGVLPASWLRLDQRSSRAKAQKNAKRYQQRQSPSRENRRGIAQSKPALPGSAANRLWLEDSDETDTELSVPPETTDDRYHNQTTLGLLSAPDPGAPRPPVSDDDASVVEDDRIDFMLPRHSGKKRQLRLLEAFSHTAKRPKSANDPIKPRGPKRSRQAKITSHFDRSADKLLSSVQSRRRASKRHDRSLEKRFQTDTSRHATPPLLSILDVIEPNAPRFLRIAARSAKRQPHQGRCSLGQKTIQLATRPDQIDAASVLHRWREGSLPQRHSVTSSMRPTAPLHRPPQPLKESSGNGRPRPKPGSRQVVMTGRKFVRHTGDGGSVTYRSSEPRKPSSNRGPAARSALPHAYVNLARPAQLECCEGDQARSSAFDAQKRMLDRLYRNNRLRVPLPRTGLDSLVETDSPPGPSASPEENPDARHGHSPESDDRPFTQRRRRKPKKPRREDIEAPRFRHLEDPLPVPYTPEPEPAQADRSTSKLLGLGPYGTTYTHNFEIFPLDASVYFHETTLIGSGFLATYTGGNLLESILGNRPCATFNLGSRALRWGAWNSQVSSEFGIVLDFVFEQLENETCALDPASLDASMFLVEYVKDSLSFENDGDGKSFAARTIECLGSFNGRIGSHMHRLAQEAARKREIVSRVYDRMILVALAVLRICQDEPALAAEKFQAEQLLKSMAMTSMSTLHGMGVTQIKETYEHLNMIRIRERGLRDDSPAVHSWVVLMNALEAARIPRASFWELVQTVIIPPSITTSTDARVFEGAWELMFALLPLTEFNSSGVIVPTRRHDINSGGWGIPQILLNRVFRLYKDNSLQSPSFNDYCRALVGRCFNLVQQWGWRRSAAVVGAIFDFFGYQGLAHLRNEEAFESPRFLEELAGQPTLDVEPGDKCFHIFLKLVALSIRKLKESKASKDIGNLAARIMPNHNRELDKEKKVLARDLAALRNHHDLLATLFWAAPADLRPRADRIEQLVFPESSHKEACLINIRCWTQLARFVVASGEASTSFKPFSDWRNAFFQQMLRQFGSVAPDVQQQVLALAKDASKLISEDLVNDTIARNKAAIGDVIYASVASSLDVLRHAVDLEAASFSLNTTQLQSVFQQFASTPPDLDWGVLLAAVNCLEAFLCRVDEFKEQEESQQSDSQILNSALADDALETVERALLRGYFSMARCVMSSRYNGDLYATARGVRAKCVEQVVDLSARLGVRYIKCGSFELSDMFRPGTYGLFEAAPHKLDLDQRRHLAHFTSSLLKHGLGDWQNANISLLEVWVLSLVKPREYLEHENQLASQLRKRGEHFVPGAVVGLTIKPDYDTNRELFGFAISHMRRCIRDAGPSLRSMLVAQHSRTLQLVMEQIKGDLRTVSNDALVHEGYVVFVREIVSLIKAHGSEIRAVDNFFYQISKEYSPSVRDPQLQVAGLISYGLRLKGGDTKSGQQLFYLLFSNVKFAIINDKLREDVRVLRKGMANQGIVNFVLGKMLPATIRAAFRDSSAFVLLDVYAEALRLLLAKKTVARELTEDELPHIAVLLCASMEGMKSWAQDDMVLSGAQAHVLRQVVGVLNLLWPSISTMAAADGGSSAWAQVSEPLEWMHQAMVAAESHVGRAMETGDGRARLDTLFAGIPSASAGQARFDADVRMFTESIVKDVHRNWDLSGNRIMIPTPANGRGSAPAQGVLLPAWDGASILADLHERAQEWCWWWDRVFGVSSSRADVPFDAVF